MKADDSTVDQTAPEQVDDGIEMAMERIAKDAKALKLANVEQTYFNGDAAGTLPHSLRVQDFQHAMQDVYDFFRDVNTMLTNKGLLRLDDMLRPAAMSGIISDMITASMAKSARVLVENTHHNGHPDLVVQGRYPNNGTASGTEGVEIKSTRKAGGAVDTHGGRDQWMCVFVYAIDSHTEPASERAPMRFTEVYLGQVTEGDFRKNKRGELGTKTATLHKNGIKKLRESWIYKEPVPPRSKTGQKGKPAVDKMTSVARRKGKGMNLS